MTQPTDSIVRDELARLRTEMANERTFLSYTRTALMLMVTGVSLIKLIADSIDMIILGWALIGLGIVVALVGIRRFFLYRNRVRQIS